MIAGERVIYTPTGKSAIILDFSTLNEATIQIEMPGDMSPQIDCYLSELLPITPELANRIDSTFDENMLVGEYLARNDYLQQFVLEDHILANLTLKELTMLYMVFRDTMGTTERALLDEIRKGHDALEHPIGVLSHTIDKFNYTYLYQIIRTFPDVIWTKITVKDLRNLNDAFGRTLWEV